MFLKKTPKAKGTYLAITESYYDKEKKTTRQKTVMGLGYVEELRKEYPDPIRHFEKVVEDMNQERESRKNSVVYVDLTASLSSAEHSLKNVGYGILKNIYKELQLDIFWRTKTWNLSLPYNIEEIFRFVTISSILYPDVSWNLLAGRGQYFESPQAISPEQLTSALGIILKYQKDIQKWIYGHSAALLSRDFSTLYQEHGEHVDTTSQSDSDFQFHLLTDCDGIPVAYDLMAHGLMQNQSVPNALKRLSKDFPECRLVLTGEQASQKDFSFADAKFPMEYTIGQPVHNSGAEFKSWILNHTDAGQELPARFIIGFASFAIMRILQVRLNFKYSSQQIIHSLLQYNCVPIAGNIYQFTYYDDLLADCEKTFGLELHNKYRSQLQIRRLLRY